MKNLIESAGKGLKLSKNDLAFISRIWNTDGETYLARLKAIGMTDKLNVLDAGCGAGQWLYSLSKLNANVFGLEYDKERFLFTERIMKELRVENCNISEGSVEKLSYDDNRFDAIFSYSVVLCTDYRKTLNEFYRVLKPGGVLYFNTNGLGWYLHNIIHTHNDTEDFSSREMAEVAIKNSLHYYATGEFKREKYSAIIMPNEVVLSDLNKIGFKKILSGPEGTINLTKQTIKPFFKGEYEGLEGVTEYLCTK